MNTGTLSESEIQLLNLLSDTNGTDCHYQVLTAAKFQKLKTVCLVVCPSSFNTANAKEKLEELWQVTSLAIWI